MSKLNIEFGPEADAILNEIAAKKSTSKADVIRRAINVYSFLEQQMEKKASIVIKLPDGGERELLVT